MAAADIGVSSRRTLAPSPRPVAGLGSKSIIHTNAPASSLSGPSGSKLSISVSGGAASASASASGGGGGFPTAVASPTSTSVSASGAVAATAAASASFQQVRKTSKPAASVLPGRPAAPSTSEPPAAGLLATTHRTKSGRDESFSLKSSSGTGTLERQKMFSEKAAEALQSQPSTSTLRRIGETAVQKINLVSMGGLNKASDIPAAPIFYESSITDNIGTNFAESRSFEKPTSNEPPVLVKPDETALYSWDKCVETLFTRESGEFAGRIQTPLLKATTNYTRAALQCFDNLLEIMGDSLSKKSKGTPSNQAFIPLQSLLSAVIKYPELIDELFAQLCKQLTNNPNTSSIEKGWDIMSACSCCLTPSDAIIKYIYAKIISFKDRSNFWPDFCAKNLRRGALSGSRQFLPSVQELAAIKNCAKVKITVAFMAGKLFPLEIESHFTCSDVCSMIEASFSVKNPTDFILFESFGELDRGLYPAERMCEILGKWELYQASLMAKGLSANYSLLYKRHLFLHPRQEIMEEVEALLTYHQAIFTVMHDYYPIEEDLLLTLAALQLCNDPKTELRKCLPKSLFMKHDAEEWERMVNQKSSFIGLRGFSPAQARTVYLRYLAQVRLFGSTFFAVKASEPPRPQQLLAVNVFGLHVLEPSTKEWLKSFSLTQLERWGFTEGTFFFRVEAEPPVPYSFDTIQGLEICATMERYSAALKKATHARAVVNYKGGIQFEAGEFIKITAKDVSPGWYTGSIGTKSGLFPISAVQLGFEDMPELDEIGNYSHKKRPEKNVVEGKPAAQKYAPKPMKEVDTHRFQFSRFASQYFRSQSSKKGKSFDPSTRACYSKQPLEESLLVLPAELNGSAVAVFDKILKYMSERGWSKPIARFAQDVVQAGIDKIDLRDEIYCQLIKQATLNTNLTSCEKVWELLAFCACCFAPSENLVDYLLAYFQVNTNWQGTTRDHAIECLRKIQLTLQYGDRALAPSIWELQSIIKGQPIICTIVLPDRSTVELPIESSTHAEDLLSRLADKIKIPEDEFKEFYVYSFVPEKKSGFRSSPGYWRSVKSTRKIADLWAAAERGQLLSGENPPPALRIKRKIVLGQWPSSVVPSNPFYSQLEFGQAFEDFVEGKIPCTAPEATIYAVLGLQALHGDFDAKKKVISPKTLPEYLPKCMLDEGGSVAGWIDKINLAYQQLAGKHLTEIRFKFLSRVRAWKLYGSSLFKVEQRKKPYVMWMAINQKGIDMLEFPKLTPISQHPFSQILSWNINKEGEVNLLLGSLQNPTKEYFLSSECQEIAEVLDLYFDLYRKGGEDPSKLKVTSKILVAPRAYAPPPALRPPSNSRLSIPKPRSSSRLSNREERNSKILLDTSSPPPNAGHDGTENDEPVPLPPVRAAPPAAGKPPSAPVAIPVPAAAAAAAPQPVVLSPPRSAAVPISSRANIQLTVKASNISTSPSTNPENRRGSNPAHRPRSSVASANFNFRKVN